MASVGTDPTLDEIFEAQTVRVTNFLRTATERSRQMKLSVLKERLSANGHGEKWRKTSFCVDEIDVNRQGSNHSDCHAPSLSQLDGERD